MPFLVKNILVGYNGFDRNEAIAALAIALAQEHGARLHVLNVTPPLPPRSWKSKAISASELHAAGTGIGCVPAQVYENVPALADSSAAASGRSTPPHPFTGSTAAGLAFFFCFLVVFDQGIGRVIVDGLEIL